MHTLDRDTRRTRAGGLPAYLAEVLRLAAERRILAADEAAPDPRRSGLSYRVESRGFPAEDELGLRAVAREAIGESISSDRAPVAEKAVFPGGKRVRDALELPGRGRIVPICGDDPSRLGRGQRA